MLKLVTRSKRQDPLGANGDFTKVFLQKKYVVEELLGQGTNAKVHKATEKKKGKIVAVKIMKTKVQLLLNIVLFFALFLVKKRIPSNLFLFKPQILTF